MAESYCMKSCAECGQCAGCRGGAFASRCEIAKCCREKNHENCESCTRMTVCITRKGRDNMPARVYEQDRREAERLVSLRANAGVMAKWTKVIFWFTIASLAVSFLGFLEEAIPAISWGILAARTALALVVAFGYWQMQGICGGFRTYAVLSLISNGITLAAYMLPEGGVLTVFMFAAMVLSVIAFRTEYLAFHDALSGIDEDMSDKWLRQWNLFKISLLLTFGGLLSCVILSVWGLVIPFAGMGILLFVVIREYVYLYQTAEVCSRYSDMEN